MSNIPPSQLRLMRVPQAPLSSAVQTGRFGMSCSDDARDSFTWTALQRMPPPWAVIVVANQPADHTASAINLRRWASFSVVHAIEPIAADYAEIAALVPVHDRLLLIETTKPYAAGWVWFLSEKPSRNFMAGEP